MALYAIGDTHLSIGKDKPMDIFGPAWDNHTEKLRAGFSKLHSDDTCVICGDISWGMGLEDTLEDFLFIDSLPGRKIILKGNHDYWWSTAAKAEKFFAAHGITTIEILNNNCFFYGETSLEAAGEREKMAFLHYPPLFLKYRCEEILALLREHEVKMCCYGHIHGKGCRMSFNGMKDGCEFRLVSADFVNFEPVLLLP